MPWVKNSDKSGFTVVSAVIIVAVLSLALWATSVLVDIILKSSMVESTEEEMGTIASALRDFFRDCDQFVKDTNDATVDLLDLEGKNGEPAQGSPDVSRFYSPASYRQSKWDGPYIQDKYNDNGYTKDAWNTAYRYDYTAGSTSCTLRSCGPDRTCGNSDDITITVSAEDIYQDKIRKVREELAYINAKKEELKRRYTNAGRTWPPAGFGIEDLFKTYGCDTTGLVAWWKMDEESWDGTSGEVIDSAGSNDGTAYGDANTAAEGKIGRCGKFDGSGDYVDAGNDSVLDIGSQLTIEAWVRPYLSGSGTAARRIINKSSSYSSSTGNGYLIQLWSNDRIYYYVAVNNNFYAVSQSTPFPHDNQFHFVAMVGSSDAGSSTLYIYLDGRQISSRTATGSFTNSTANLYIGRGISGYFPGYIDEVRIWNRALTSDDVFLEYLRGTYLVDWAYKYDEWQMEYQWDSTNDEFYSYGPDRAAGGGNDIYQTQ
ncbi:MAG TPA: LamG domain-containing protein [Candidatus Omnitrophica bacterium]|nr:LamG domain-containing protein [Candidatus Omnitrophota bacterium]